METRTRELDRDEWGKYFDRVSQKLGAMKINLIVLGLDIGAQLETERVLLQGITYDRHDDALDVFAEGLEHRIQGPKQIFVEEDASGRLVSCEVADADGHKQILQLDPSLLLLAS
jgi:hypothetical protein